MTLCEDGLGRQREEGLHVFDYNKLHSFKKASLCTERIRSTYDPSVEPMSAPPAFKIELKVKEEVGCGSVEY